MIRAISLIIIEFRVTLSGKGGAAVEKKDRIAALRREAGMNQRELGQKLGVGQTTISA